MRENFLIIFIQIFLINSLIFWTMRASARDGRKCNQIILLNGKISSSKADYLTRISSSWNIDYLSVHVWSWRKKKTAKKLRNLCFLLSGEKEEMNIVWVVSNEFRKKCSRFNIQQPYCRCVRYIVLYPFLLHRESPRTMLLLIFSRISYKQA